MIAAKSATDAEAIVSCPAGRAAAPASFRTGTTRPSEVAENGDMALCVALARHRLGALLGGDEGRALIMQAEQWMASQGIARPDRVLALFAPGFAVP